MQVTPNVPRNTRIEQPGEPGGCVLKPKRVATGLFPGWGPKLF